MTSSFTTFLNLAAPFIVGILFLLLQFCLRKGDVGTAEIVLPSLWPIKPIKLKWKSPNVLVLRLVLVLFTVGCFLAPAFRDYSDLLPIHFRMEVFFDDEGIERVLASFTDDEVAELGIAADWQSRKRDILARLSDTARKRLGSSFEFDAARGVVHSTGDTYFEVAKIKGWQKYHIQKAGGSLIHVYEAPSTPRRTLASEFHLLSTDSNIIALTLGDIYFRWTMVIKPEFKQVVRLPSGEAMYDHKLVAVTKVRFFPAPDIGKSLYLHADGRGTTLVPIAYCVYIPD